jgi:hypothetical protein
MSSWAINSNGLVIQNGILQTGPSNMTEINILLNQTLGSIRSQFDLGIGIYTYLNSKDMSGLKSEIMKQCAISGNKLTDVEVSGQNITVIANE